RAGTRSTEAAASETAMAAGEQAHQRVAGHHSARDARRGGQCGAQEPGATLLEHARLVVRRVLRRRWRGLGVIRLLRISLLRPALLAPRVRAALWRRRRLLLPSAAKQPAEETAATGGLLLGLLQGLLRLLHFPFQSLDAVLRLDQRMFLHESELGDAIARLRVGLELLGDQRVGFAIHRRQGWLRGCGHRSAAEPRLGLGRAADTCDELADDVALFVGHDRIPKRSPGL